MLDGCQLASNHNYIIMRPKTSWTVLICRTQNVEDRSANHAVTNVSVLYTTLICRVRRNAANITRSISQIIHTKALNIGHRRGSEQLAILAD